MVPPPDTAGPETAAADKDVSFCDTSSASVASPSELASRVTNPPTQAVCEEALSADVRLTLDGFALDEVTLVNSSMLSYLAMVASLIEGRAIGVEELLEMLRRSMRQRSFDRLPRREYVLGFLNQHPP